MRLASPRVLRGSLLLMGLAALHRRITQRSANAPALPAGTTPSPASTRGRALAYIPATTTGDAAEQMDRLRRLCSEHALELADVVREADTPDGATIGARPGLYRVLQELAANRATVLVVAHWTDLAGNEADRALVQQWLSERGRQVLTLDAAS